MRLRLLGVLLFILSLSTHAQESIKYYDNKVKGGMEFELWTLRTLSSVLHYYNLNDPSFSSYARQITPIPVIENFLDDPDNIEWLRLNHPDFYLKLSGGIELSSPTILRGSIELPAELRRKRPELSRESIEQAFGRKPAKQPPSLSGDFQSNAAGLLVPSPKIEAPNINTYEYIKAQWRALPHSEQKMYFNYQKVPAYVKALCILKKKCDPSKVSLRNDLALDDRIKKLAQRLHFKKEREIVEVVHTEPTNYLQLEEDIRTFAAMAGVEHQLDAPRLGGLSRQSGFTLHFHVSPLIQNQPIAGLPARLRLYNLKKLLMLANQGLAKEALTSDYGFESFPTERGFSRLSLSGTKAENRLQLERLEKELRDFAFIITGEHAAVKEKLVREIEALLTLNNIEEIARYAGLRANPLAPDEVVIDIHERRRIAEQLGEWGKVHQLIPELQNSHLHLVRTMAADLTRTQATRPCNAPLESLHTSQ